MSHKPSSAERSCPKRFDQCASELVVIVEPGVSRTLTPRLQKLERHIIQDSVVLLALSHVDKSQSSASSRHERLGSAGHSVYAVTLLSDLANPKLTPVLRAKAAGLEMKMRKHMMEQT